MIKFVKHRESFMGAYIEQVNDPLLGQCERIFAFNLAENPELAQQYLAWVAEGNISEPWNPEPAPVDEAHPSTDAG